MHFIVVILVEKLHFIGLEYIVSPVLSLFYHAYADYRVLLILIIQSTVPDLYYYSTHKDGAGSIFFNIICCIRLGVRFSPSIIASGRSVCPSGYPMSECSSNDGMQELVVFLQVACHCANVDCVVTDC